MGKRYYVAFFWGIFLFCLGVLGYGPKMHVAAYSAKDIGLYNDTTSIVGMSVHYEGELQSYAYDVWHRQGGEWVYDSTNFNGESGQIKDKTYNSSLVWIMNPDENKKRFSLNLSNITNKYGSYENYSVIIEHYYRGKLYHRYLETPFADLSSYTYSCSLIGASANNKSGIDLGGYGGDYACYSYNLYRILNLEEKGDIKTASGNWSIREAGKAYYDGSQYLIHSLPKATMQEEGYVCTLDGWYSAQTGGKQYQPGDTIQKGVTLYPRWTKTPKQYPVQCIDVLGNDSSGLRMGESTWMQDYDSIAIGSEAGCIPVEGVYYDGMVYTGCSQKTVKLSDNIVYRYFDYAQYPVQIVDRVIAGPNSGMELSTVSRQERYKTSVSGSVLGTDESVGAYYQGYYYQQSTSGIVGKDGITVYRYFVPIQYDISFDGSGATSGNMATIRGCWYDQQYTLIPNAYTREITLTLDLQAEDAVCDTQEKKVPLIWNGWAESDTGGVRYSDQAYVRNLRNCEGENTLYAVWKPADVSLTAVPKRMGYSFAGWAETPDAVSGNMDFQLQQDTTLYAIWKPDISEYHVEYYKESSGGNFELTTQYTFSSYTGSVISIDSIIPNYQGYYLDQGSSSLKGTVSGDGSLVLMAYYRRNTYQILFDERLGSDEPHVLQGTFEQEIRIPDYIPKREGYQFAGWTADPDRTQVYCMPGENYRIPNHDQVLYAIWQPNAYEVRFQDNVPKDDKDPVKGDMPSMTGYYEMDITIPACGWSRNGYQFVGWNTLADGSGKTYSANQQVQSLYDRAHPMITLYALWKPLEGEVEYQLNIPKNCSSQGKGIMTNTAYRYDDHWNLEPCHYELPGYDFCGWNTSADGSGKSYPEKAEMYKKLPLSGVQKLYAIWKPRKDTKFYLQLEKPALNQQESSREILVLEGETDGLVSDAVVAYYQNQGIHTSIKDFITGFTVTNPEVLENNTLTADGQTILSLTLERKKYHFRILRDTSDQESECYGSRELLYEDIYCLPKQIDGIGAVRQYVDAEGNVYLPGDEIRADRDYSFMIQHRLIYHIDGEEKETYVSHNMPVVLEKPLEKEYYFSSWYWDEKYRDHAGNANDIIYVMNDQEVFAKWSEEKITYQIRYELGNYQDVLFLDDVVHHYQYGDQSVLPVAAQMFIPKGYQFIGWYDMEDAKKTILTTIPKDAYGDKVYCLQLQKQSKPNDRDPDNGNGTGSGSDLPDTDTKADQADTSVSNVSGNHINAFSEIPQTLSRVLSNRGKSAKNDSSSVTRNQITYQKINADTKAVTVVAVSAKVKKVKIPEYITWNGIRYPVTAISAKAFYDCRKLTSVTIGKRVNRIGKKAFYGCKKLKKVTFQGNKIRKIHKNAFAKANAKLRFSMPQKCRKKYIRFLKQSHLKKIKVISGR